MRNETRAYAAGLFDAEGCIVVAHHKRTDHRPHEQYELSCVISNTDEAIVQWLADQFGGNVVEVPRDAPQRTNWRWSLWGHRVEDFLQKIWRYLVVKANEAQIAHQFLPGLPVQMVGTRLSELEILRRQTIKLKLEELKQAVVPASEHVAKGPMKMSTTVLQYLAGFFDGEGTVGIGVTNHKNSKNPSHELSVQVGCTHPRPVECLYEVFGGGIRCRKNDKSRRGFKPLHVWYVTSRVAATALERLLPYLRIKKPQAELAVEFQKYKTSTRPRPASAGVAPLVLAERGYYRDRLMALNHE